MLKYYTGDKALGPEVSGLFEIELASDRIIFSPLTRKPFTLPSDQWTELDLDLPIPLPAGSLLRITLITEPTRVPARLMPGSQDERELGLAVLKAELK